MECVVFCLQVLQGGGWLWVVRLETGVRMEDNNRILSYYLIVEVQLAF